ncbi:hypothetical protein [Sulfitobacter sp. JB4-11]|uniref:hypothetical protein n=1 Tax=Sulfitobacter rhodophyticola TaxID=3238304 RepID=UPI003D81863F
MIRRTLALGALVLVAGCGDPLEDFDRISDVTLAQDAVATQAVPTQAEMDREGFLGTASAAETTPDIALPETAGASQSGGILGLFRRARENVAVAASQVEAEDGQIKALGTQGDEGDTVLAALPTEPDAPERSASEEGRALFTGRKPSFAQANDVPYGTSLPYGVVARVCEARGRDMGRQVEKGPVRGFAIYDTAPGTATARTYYLTGFSDGCPRQLTAANVLVGSPALYDMLHYGPAAQDLPYGATDKAYEKVKSQVCGVSRKKPCGSRIKRLEKRTFFINAYDSFGNARRWSEMLIHDGEVLATAMKSSG